MISDFLFMKGCVEHKPEQKGKQGAIKVLFIEQKTLKKKKKNRLSTSGGKRVGSDCKF